MYAPPTRSPERSSAHPSRRHLIKRLCVLAISALLVLVGCGASGLSQGSNDSSKGSEASGEGSKASGDSSEGSGGSSEGSSNSSEGSSTSNNNDGGDASASSLIAALVIIGIGAVVAIGYAVTTTANTQAQQTAKRYLEKNRRMIRVSIARGEGPLVNDLGATLEIPPDKLAQLGSTLQASYPRLEGYLDEAELSADDVEGFSTTLIAVVGADPELAPHVQRLRTRLNGGVPAP